MIGGSNPFELHCNNCRLVLDTQAFREGRYVSDLQTGHVYCDAKCLQAHKNATQPIKQHEADALEEAEVARFKAFCDWYDAIIEAQSRADTLARLERALEAMV